MTQCRVVALLVTLSFAWGCGSADPVAAQPQPGKAASPPPAAADSPAPSGPVDTDLRKLPRLPGAVAKQESAAFLTYAANATVADALAFQVAELGKLGWQEVTEGNQKFATDEFAQDAFAKNGHALSLSIQKGSVPGTVEVQLRSHGNVDVRKLPVFAQGKALYGNQTTSMYSTPAKVAEVAAFTLKQLTADGWRPYKLANSAGPDNPDQKFLYFMRDGVAVEASVMVAPAQQGETVVQYSTRMLENNLPTPKDAVAVEFDEHKPYLKFFSPTSVEQLAKFYYEALPEVGREPLKAAAPPTEKRGFLLFDNATHRLVVELTREDQVTVVEMREISLAALKKAEEQAQKEAAEKAAPPATPPTPALPATPQVDIKLPPIDLGPAKPKPTPPNTAGPAQAFTATAAFPAKTLPLPKDATGVEYGDEEVKFTSPTGVLDLVEFYRATFASWKEDKRFSIVKPQLATFNLKHGDLELSFRLINVLGQETEVTVSGDALTP